MMAFTHSHFLFIQPLYNQPSDTAVYHENKRKYLTFKETLMEHLKKKHIENEERDKYLASTYSRLMQEWVRKVERTESSQKRKAKEAKNREFFEKVFTELRKAREDKERFNRVGARIKSEADMEEIMDGLQEQEVSFIHFSMVLSCLCFIYIYNIDLLY